MRGTVAQLSILLLATGCSANAVALADLAQAADAIVIGTVTIRSESPTLAAFDIGIDRMLKGAPLQIVHVSHHWNRRSHLLDDPQGTQTINKQFRGIWFLQNTNTSDWEVLPVREPSNTIVSLYWPAAAGSLPAVYQMATNPSLLDTLLFELAAGVEEEGLHPEDLESALESMNSSGTQIVLNHMVQSVMPAFRSYSLAALLKRKQPGILTQLSTMWPSISHDPNRLLVLTTLATSFRDTTAESVRELGALLSNPTTTPELRRSSIRALAAIHTKEAIPFLGQLLSSSDPGEQGQAVFGIGAFANGCPSQTPDNIPTGEFLQFKYPAYRTAQTTAHFVFSLNTPTVSEIAPYVSFWKDWWSHRPELH